MRSFGFSAEPTTAEGFQSLRTTPTQRTSSSELASVPGVRGGAQTEGAQRALRPAGRFFGADRWPACSSKLPRSGAHHADSSPGSSEPWCCFLARRRLLTEIAPRCSALEPFGGMERSHRHTRSHGVLNRLTDPLEALRSRRWPRDRRRVPRGPAVSTRLEGGLWTARERSDSSETPRETMP